MTDRELMQMALDALELVTDLTTHDDELYEAIDAISARLAQPEPEPVAYDINGATVYIKPPVYTAPPQREWQGLTDEEIDQAAWPHFIGNILPSVKIIVRQLEAKLKEKNG